MSEPSELDEIKRVERELVRRWLALPVEGSADVSVLCLRVSQRWVAVPLNQVQEVVRACWCEPMVDAPDWIVGSFLLEGTSVPVVNLGLRLGEEATALNRSALILVVQHPLKFGLLIDEVSDVQQFSPDETTPTTSAFPSALIVAEGLLKGRKVGLLSLLALARDVPEDDAK